MSQSAVASLKMLSMDMVCLAIEFAASLESFSRSCRQSAPGRAEDEIKTNMLGDAFKMDQGLAHGRTNVFLTHDDFLGEQGQSSVCKWHGSLPHEAINIEVRDISPVSQCRATINGRSFSYLVSFTIEVVQKQ